tara:strand:- start:83 stop:466 length:384 start_codon:yes stop_codon:yes gene_type:complete
MTERRPLSNDLTDQGKYQLAHGEPSTTHTIVVLSDDDTIEPADGCTMEVWTTDYEDMDERPGPDDGDLISSYNVAALPDLVQALGAMLVFFRVYESRAGKTSETRRFYLAAVEMAQRAIAKATGGDV